MTTPKQSYIVQYDNLRGFISRSLISVDIPAKDAEIVAGLMAQADLQGSDGHGVIRLPQYVKRIRAGGINTRPNIQVVQERAAMAVVDGDNAMGHLAVSQAVQLAIEKARSAGVAWVGTRNSNHAGPASLYARMPVAHNMIGLYFAVGNANHLPAWGGMGPDGAFAGANPTLTGHGFGGPGAPAGWMYAPYAGPGGEHQQ